MTNYKFVDMPNLDLITQKIYDVIAQHGLPDCPSVYYLDPEGTEDRFKQIPELSNAMKQIGLYDYWTTTAAIVCYTDGLPIHDDSEPNYALVLPIKNNKDAFTVFYDVVGDPIEKFVESKHAQLRYFMYTPEQSREIERVEITRPTIINVRVPHNVIVYSKETPRITLAMRLHDDFKI